MEQKQYGRERIYINIFLEDLSHWHFSGTVLLNCFLFSFSDIFSFLFLAKNAFFPIPKSVADPGFSIRREIGGTQPPPTQPLKWGHKPILMNLDRVGGQVPECPECIRRKQESWSTKTFWNTISPSCDTDMN